MVKSKVRGRFSNFAAFSEHMNFKLKLAVNKVMRSNTSRLEEHAGFFRLLMKGIFDYVLYILTKIVILIINAR